MGKKVTLWFARGGGIAKSGPFKTQVEAVAAMRQVTETDEEYRQATYYSEEPRKQYKGGFPDDIFVWPEEVPAKP